MQKIKPLDESPDCTDSDQLAARRYLADQGISLTTAIAAHIGCLRHYCITKNSEDKREQASSIFPCIAYVNYVDGRPVNAKYRSCSPIQSPKPEEGQPLTYSKFWSQDSPTTPCAPYNIDCINPLLVEEEIIPRLIIVEGGKDALTFDGSRIPPCHQRTLGSGKRPGKMLRGLHPLAGPGTGHRDLR